MVGPDGNLLKVRKIIRIEGIYSPPKPKVNETDNSKSFSSNEAKPEKQTVQPSDKSSNEKLWVGAIIGLFIGIGLGSIIWWLLKRKKTQSSK